MASQHRSNLHTVVYTASTGCSSTEFFISRMCHQFTMSFLYISAQNNGLKFIQTSVKVLFEHLFMYFNCGDNKPTGQVQKMSDRQRSIADLNNKVHIDLDYNQIL